MIELHTRLNDGIYQSQGGGQDIVAQSWATGPRHLMTAIAALTTRRAEMIRCYGNVGCGNTWLAVDGVTLDDADCAGVIYAEDVRRDWAESDDHGPQPLSQTAEAQVLLVRLARERATREAAATLGRAGGRVSSPAKTAAVRENGKRGGRPLALATIQGETRRLTVYWQRTTGEMRTGQTWATGDVVGTHIVTLEAACAAVDQLYPGPEWDRQSAA